MVHAPRTISNVPTRLLVSTEHRLFEPYTVARNSCALSFNGTTMDDSARMLSCDPKSLIRKAPAKLHEPFVEPLVDRMLFTHVFDK